jgi:hypothetical protein
MVESLQTLLGGIIDYAGMYPPAQLPLNQALRSYVRYKTGKEAWIVNRFICPAAKVTELEAGLKWQHYDDRFGLCITGRGGASNSEFLTNTLADTKSARRNERVFFDAFETRLPLSLLDSNEMAHVIMQIVRGLEEETVLYLEVPFSDQWQSQVPRAIETIAKNPRARAKIRLGGDNKSARPSVEQVAVFISECAKNELPFKATAGLHHPIRRFDEETGGMMHGFLNVFVAAAVAQNLSDNPSDLVPILGATDPAAFRCLGSRLSFGNWHLSIKHLKASREFAVGFGSCSVSDPLTDLAHLGHAVRVPV